MARPCVTAICKASIASISFCGFSPSITAKAALTALASTLLLLSRKTVSSRASSISTNAGELVPSASVNRVCQPRSSECVGVTDSSVCLQPNYEPWPPRNLSAPSSSSSKQAACGACACTTCAIPMQRIC
jgi:hypothetical protein